MKKTFILAAIALFLIGIIGVYADEAETSFGTNVTVGGSSSICVEPVIYRDHTARIWEPNDQTWYTASEYGYQVENAHGYTGWAVPLRQNYAFTGETLKYFIIVEEPSGAADINYLSIMVGPNVVGQCREVPAFSTTSAFIGNNGATISSYNPATMKSYVCTMIVQSGWSGQLRVRYRASTCNPALLTASQDFDTIFMNPDLNLAMVGSVNFGSVSPGSNAMSNTVLVRNAASLGSGVMMDMYIASDDYFTDPSSSIAICGDGNGIKYDQFSFYATKGSINSGANNNAYSALGEDRVSLCVADPTEFTPLPSHSGHIEDMCRIINHNEHGSILSQGSEMSMTFKLNVPTPCVGTFTDGEFHIVGRVV